MSEMRMGKKHAIIQNVLLEVLLYVDCEIVLGIEVSLLFICDDLGCAIVV